MELLVGVAGIAAREKITITPPKSGVRFFSYYMDWMERGIQLNEVLSKLSKNKSHNIYNYRLTVYNAS